jgi:DNA gyrase/topoisomerase IV subunit B
MTIGTKTRLRLEIKNRGYLWEQDFSLGVPDYDLRQVRPLEDGERTGTTVTWFASPEIFETTDYNLETISTRFREMAFLNKGLRIELRDARPKAEELAEPLWKASGWTASRLSSREGRVEPQPLNTVRRRPASVTTTPRANWSSRPWAASSLP